MRQKRLEKLDPIGNNKGRTKTDTTAQKGRIPRNVSATGDRERRWSRAARATILWADCGSEKILYYKSNFLFYRVFYTVNCSMRMRV